MAMHVLRVPFREQTGDPYRVWFSIGLIVAAAVIAWLLPVRHGGAVAIVCGTAGGVIGHWRATVPAKITAGARVAEEARHWFERRSYAWCAETGELVPRLPRVLRFDSQNVRFIHEWNGTVTIVAPYFLLKAFAKSAGL